MKFPKASPPHISNSAKRSEPILTDPSRHPYFATTLRVVVSDYHHSTMKVTMIGVLFAASSSAAAAFGPRAAFRASTTRSFSRTSELFANPKGT
jgi:hypothetical protein